jgi:hypothetical protein
MRSYPRFGITSDCLGQRIRDIAAAGPTRNLRADDRVLLLRALALLNSATKPHNHKVATCNPDIPRQVPPMMYSHIERCTCRGDFARIGRDWSTRPDRVPGTFRQDAGGRDRSPREGLNMRWVPPWWMEGLQDQHHGGLAAVTRQTNPRGLENRIRSRDCRQGRAGDRGVAWALTHPLSGKPHATRSWNHPSSFGSLSSSAMSVAPDRSSLRV